MRKLTMDELERLGVEDFKNVPKTPLTLVLDNVRSALNVGSAFRTADAFALEKVVLCGITATPPHREILKTALGATESVAWEYFENATLAAEKLKKEGFKIYAVEQTTESASLQSVDFQKDGKMALVFGNEVSGVSHEWLALADGSIEIPQFGTKHSLNIAVCIGIVTWEATRKMRSLDMRH
jgi:tRNA G18 (ribose-2'-O)-methylase SpoU